MSGPYDTIVIGSGDDGLTCACHLAKAGMKVLALEQYASTGAMTTTEEVTPSGFHSHTHTIGYQMEDRSLVPRELRRHRYGFALLHAQIGFSQAFPDGASSSVFRDMERTCGSIARFSARDADAWRTLCPRPDRRCSVAQVTVPGALRSMLPREADR